MVSLENVFFSYPEGSFVLDIPSFTLMAGEKQLLMAPSGEGKTTLLNLIAGILQPLRGRVVFREQPLEQLNPSQRRKIRLEQMGIVFQDLELLEYLTVYDNIRLNSLLDPKSGVASKAQEQDILKLAEEAGIADKLKRYPAKLSKGEQQRAALCRALLGKPELILADEATGNLDVESKRRIWDMVSAYSRLSGAAVLAVSHDASLSAYFHKVVTLDQLCREKLKS